MMATEEKLTLEDVRYLKVAIALALDSPNIVDMSKTKRALNELYDKIEKNLSNRGE